MTDFRIRITDLDEETLFVGKKLALRDVTVSTPCKLLDLNNAPSISSMSALDRNYLNKIPLIEKSRFIHQETYMREADHPDARFLSDSYDSLKQLPTFRDKMVINSLTLTFNPFNIPSPEKYLTSILHIYHGRSDLLLIPNLKVTRYDDRQRREFQVTPEEFNRYIDLAHQILNFRNSKPIFVPLPLKYGVRRFQEFLTDYLGRGYRYFWLDFEGSNTTSKAAHIRAFHNIVDTEGLEDEVVLYGSNIRRENNPHLSELRCPVSDFLTAPLGVDIIGVNREPQRGGGDGTGYRNYVPPPIEDVIPHKARFLDREDYTYVRYPDFPQHDQLMDKYHVVEPLLRNNPRFYANFINTFEINEELAHHQTLIAENESLLGYLGTKASINSKLMRAFERTVQRDSQPQMSLDTFF
jgi:hypothetical protein